MQQLYEIVKFTESGHQRIIKRNQTIEQAQAICSDPDTSSMTARKPQGCNSDEKQIDRWHETEKHWFYGFRNQGGAS